VTPCESLIKYDILSNNQERYIFGDNKQQCSWMGNVETCECQHDLEHY
jgi:hypothetical protein